MVARSATFARVWTLRSAWSSSTAAHTFEAAHSDYESGAPKIARGGILAIHDLFPDPNEGGQAPIEVYRRALASGDFDELPTTKTLGVLRRK